MPLMNHTAFPELVESGAKRQSIRAPRKHGEFRKGNPIFHYVGLRHAGARKILDAVCTGVTPISISAAGNVRLGGARLDASDIAKVAGADGFNCPEAFVDYFTLGRRKRLRKDFIGNLITWKPLKELWK